MFLTSPEAEKIRKYLRLGQGWFRRRYLQRLEDGELVLADGKEERCIFLNDAEQCRIYPARPLQCRTYPFWPELAGNGRAWINEARRCEGINQGDVVPLATIRRKIRACVEQEN